MGLEKSEWVLTSLNKSRQQSANPITGFEICILSQKINYSFRSVYTQNLVFPVSTIKSQLSKTSTSLFSNYILNFQVSNHRLTDPWLKFPYRLSRIKGINPCHKMTASCLDCFTFIFIWNLSPPQKWNWLRIRSSRVWLPPPPLIDHIPMTVTKNSMKLFSYSQT